MRRFSFFAVVAFLFALLGPATCATSGTLTTVKSDVDSGYAKEYIDFDFTIYDENDNLITEQRVIRVYWKGEESYDVDAEYSEPNNYFVQIAARGDTGPQDLVVTDNKNTAVYSIDIKTARTITNMIIMAVIFVIILVAVVIVILFRKRLPCFVGEEERMKALERGDEPLDAPGSPGASEELE